MLAQMNDDEFNALADAALRQIEAALEQSGAELDFAMISDHVLEIEFADRSKMVVNRHDAAKEKLLLEHGAKTAAELKEQQNAAFPEVKREQPEKAAWHLPVLPAPSTEPSVLFKRYGSMALFR